MKEVYCWIRVGRYVLRNILDNGRFKSIFEEQSTTGYEDNLLEVRVQRDFNLYGYSPDLPAEERPIYGYLCGNVDGNASHGHFILDEYGSCAVRLKDEIKARTTFCINESLYHGSPIEFSEEALPEGLDMIIPYVEAQYHGGVYVQDIAEVVWWLDRESQRASIEDIIELLKARGIVGRVCLYEQ